MCGFYRDSSQWGDDSVSIDVKYLGFWILYK